MAKVIVKLRVMPNDVNVNLEAVRKEICNIRIEDVEIKNTGVVPIAFGLKAISVVALMPDKEGLCDKFVDKIKKIDGVQNVEVEAMDLL